MLNPPLSSSKIKEVKRESVLPCLTASPSSICEKLSVKSLLCARQDQCAAQWPRLLECSPHRRNKQKGTVCVCVCVRARIHARADYSVRSVRVFAYLCDRTQRHTRMCYHLTNGGVEMRCNSFLLCPHLLNTLGLAHCCCPSAITPIYRFISYSTDS